MTHPDPQFEALLLYLRDARGFDFTGYKRSSVMRRVDRRMADVNIADYGEYLDYLELHAAEFTPLFNTVLINVTGFFRDADAWAHLRYEALPAALAGRSPSAPVRVWSAGCASGEEAYSLAMILADSLPADDFRRVKIYATDVDEESLAQARQASYDARAVAGVPPDLLERYFEPQGGRFTVRSDLRRSVIFGRNDLVQDAPISRVDLLVCRNTLMYFNAETQSRILSRFHFALAPSGVLFLGKAEMLLSHTDQFRPVDLRRRLFRKVLPDNRTETPTHAQVSPPPSARDEPARSERLHKEAFAANPVAQVVVTADGLVALTNRQAEALFAVSAKDIGRPFRDLDLSYRPVELRGHIEHAQLEGRTRRVTNVDYIHTSGDALNLEIQVSPLTDADSSMLGVAIIFLDVTAAHRLRNELEYTNRQLESAYEELQSANEELETTNEELQSTVEELETTNEELQSTNEELETMNEELQSTNDELQIVNSDLQLRTDELDDANSFLGAILTGLRAGIAVIDSDLRVRIWNLRAEDLWGLRASEAIGQHFLNLDIGLPTDLLRPLLRQVLGSGSTETKETSLTAINRRGRTIEVRVVGTPLGGTNGGAPGAILVMDPIEATPDPAPSAGGDLRPT
ncbi:MAG: two-component system, chemotaxis family, CheB/CheR fusion protein [Micromonosporaceae bacterium]|nr:two-component system, chemotaxis family, CheB/CheR fusion protein [Micromonosporaceae bacterium]